MRASEQHPKDRDEGDQYCGGCLGEARALNKVELPRLCDELDACTTPHIDPTHSACASSERSALVMQWEGVHCV
jgi:hypothetical protein